MPETRKHLTIHNLNHKRQLWTTSCAREAQKTQHRRASTWLSGALPLSTIPLKASQRNKVASKQVRHVISATSLCGKSDPQLELFHFDGHNQTTAQDGNSFCNLEQWPDIYNSNCFNRACWTRLQMWPRDRWRVGTVNVGARIRTCTFVKDQVFRDLRPHNLLGHHECKHVPLILCATCRGVCPTPPCKHYTI